MLLFGGADKTPVVFWKNRRVNEREGKKKLVDKGKVKAVYSCSVNRNGN